MKKIVTILSFAFLLVACESSENRIASFEEVSGKNLQPAQLRESTVVNDTKEPKLQKKLIKNGRVTFETNDLTKTRTIVDDAVKKYGAYISSESENKRYDRINQYMQIRVPSKSFDSLLESIAKGVERFDVKEINISDVTERFYDLQSRINNKKKLEIRYLQILKKAKTVKEILDVERELGKLREEIESAEGKLKYLSNQVDFSTLTLNFYKKTSNESSFLGKITESFKDGFSGIKTFFLFLISVWPFLIVAIILYFIIKRKFK